MNDRTQDTPTTPGDLAGASPRELLDAWHRHVSRLVEARHNLADPPLPVGRLVGHALDALAVGQALTDAISNTRWTTASEALARGAGVERVAAAMGLDVDEVLFGLRSWADGQLQHGGLTPAGYDELCALVADAADGGSE
ncbi:MAG: hypothetical protein JWO67_1508 [Streptosporangiaceae bacterium]|nr:hypothetical protein [Streptosporangiaceae bacterium]